MDYESRQVCGLDKKHLEISNETQKYIDHDVMYP